MHRRHGYGKETMEQVMLQKRLVCLKMAMNSIFVEVDLLTIELRLGIDVSFQVILSTPTNTNALKSNTTAQHSKVE